MIFPIYQTITIGGKTKEELKNCCENVSEYAKYMIDKMELSPREEIIDLVRVTVKDLFGDDDWHTTDKIYQKAKHLGFELCPAEVGPHLRMKLKDQPMGDWLRIAMKQITDPDGGPCVFYLEHDGDGMWLSNDWTEPTRGWNPGHGFVFRLRKDFLGTSETSLSLGRFDALEKRVKDLEEKLNRVCKVLE